METKDLANVELNEEQLEAVVAGGTCCCCVKAPDGRVRCRRLSREECVRRGGSCSADTCQS